MPITNTQTLKNLFLLLFLSTIFLMMTIMEPSEGIFFEARNLTESEKLIAEKDYLSIAEKCYDRLAAKEDSGETCDAFIGYFINQCAALDNLLSYCDIDYDESQYVSPVRDYEFVRYYQQGCIKQNLTFMDSVFCEDYIDIPGEAERRFFKTLTNKSHLIIPSATLYTNDYNSQIFGEVLNNYTYPINSTHILARLNYTNGSVIDFENGYTRDSIIKPGDKSGFWFFFENPLPKSTRFTTTTEFQRANITLPEKLSVSNPKGNISDTSTIEGTYTDFSEISGKITNLGNITATSVRINAIFYDAIGKVADVNTEYVNIGTGLPPGKSQSFSLQPILNYDKRDEIVSYALNAESNEYSMKR